MRIIMPRGDLYPVVFQVYETETELTHIDFTQIYMTCKKTNKDRTPLFQKSLTNGDIVKVSDGEYKFSIEPEDTNNLQFGEYTFDIELLNDNPRIKQTITGTLRLSEETTWAINEVG